MSRLTWFHGLTYGLSLMVLRIAEGVPPERLAPSEAAYRLSSDECRQSLHTEQYQQGLAACQGAVQLATAVFGPQHSEVVRSLNNLAFFYREHGQYSEAEPLLSRVLVMKEHTLGAQHPDVATSHNNLAFFYLEQGKRVQAEPHFRLAVDIWEKTLGEQDPRFIESLNNLAVFYSDQGQYAQAEPLFKRALASLTRLLGERNPKVVEGLSNLAEVSRNQGKYEQAEPLFRRALVLRQQLLGAHHLDVADSLSQLADLYATQGKYAQAEPLLKQALEIQTQVLGPEHPKVAKCLEELAKLKLARGQLGQALPYLLHSLKSSESLLRQTVSEPRVAALLERCRGADDLVYSLLLEQPHNTSLAATAMTLTLFRKGRAAEAGAHANRALFDSLKTQEQRDRFTRWQQLRSAHEQKLFAGPGTQDPTQYREQLAEVRRQIDVLEEQLADASPLVRTLTPRKWDDMLPAISSKLPSRSALVEIVLTNRIQLRAAGATSRWDGPHYLAMVLFPNQRIAVADLGEAASVDRTATELLVGLQSSSSDPLPAAQALYKAIVSPLEANISDLSRLYLSLDGRLNLIPFAALHDGRQYLVERYQLDYLTSGRDLLREPVGSGQQPAVFADPDFTGLPPGRGLATTRAVDRSMRGLYAELGKLPRLPGTRREAQMLARLLPTAVVRTGQAATEQTLRQVRAPLLLHIATHGVFLQDEPPQALRESLSGRAFTPLTSAQSPMPDPASISFRALGQREASPLSRSALLFAGAAQAAQSPTADQDGLLTAEEARSLNLWGTQLVVLSACETGQGLVSTGQGVYGLRRAFFIAGAETLVTSLWMVADEETGDLMNSFYQKLILERKPTVRAMQEAMLDLRRKKPHPYFWAPFIVLGRDAPLRNQSASGPIAPVY